jgi:hypothetical protein
MHQPIAYAVSRLQVELMICLDGREAHVLTDDGDGVGDCLGGNDSVLVRLYRTTARTAPE